MNTRPYHFLLGFNALLLTVLVPCTAISQTVNNSPRCKALAISGAQWAKQSYAFSKESYLADNAQEAFLNADSSLYCIKQSISSIDSCMALATDSDFLAKSFAEMAKKNAEHVIVALKNFSETEKRNNKKEFAWNAVNYSAQTTLDAYHASFYFEGDTPPEKKPGNTPQPTDKKITKLDVDQALFALLNEQIHEKSEKHKKEIASLEEKIKKSKDPVQTKKLKDELKKLEQQETTLVKKNVETSEKLSKINELIEERNKNTNASIKNEETVFAKGLNKPAEEWNKQVLLDTDLPNGLIYQVQIGVYKNAIVPEIFKGLTPVFGKTVAGGVSYSTGMFEKLADAQQAKTYVKGMGLTDAFIVAYHNKKKISLAEAAKLEKK
jgi:hypothetical protein